MISLKQFTGTEVTARDDAILYSWLSSKRCCVTEGCEITSLGENNLSISAGRIVIQGREIEVTQENFQAQMAEPGKTWPGRVYLEIDLSNTQQPCALKTQAASSLDELVQEELNDGTGGVYQFELCTYLAGDTVITDVVMTADRFDGAVPGQNLLVNSDFTDPVARREILWPVTGSQPIIDGWEFEPALGGGRLTLTEKGLQFSQGGGTIRQTLPNAVGEETSVNLGVAGGSAQASYSDATKEFSITSEDGTVAWAKLERGPLRTAYRADGYGVELARTLPRKAYQYSIGELPTGMTWIDGKPIYRKTVQCGALPNKSTTITPFDIPDKEIIWIDLSASFSINPTNGESLPIVLAESNNYTASITAWLGSEDIRIRASGSDRSMFTQTYVTLLYTKTTD